MTNRIRIDYTDFMRLRQDIADKIAAVEGLEREINLMAAREIFTGVKNEMRESQPAGKTYRRYNPFRVHTASAPGQPPAIDLGRFIRSVYLRKARGNTYIVGSTDKRAEWFSYGTRYMEARPWLLPGIKRAHPIIMEKTKAIIGKYMK